MITFDYDQHTYQVSMDAYTSDLDIKLPDGRILRPNGWSEKFPPQPAALTVVSKRPSGGTIKATLVK